MKQIELLPTFSLSQLVYGVWRWDEKTQSEKDISTLIDTCLSLGIDSFDHADIYNDYANEAFFGKLLKDNPSKRHQIKIITKCGIQLLSQKKPLTKVKHYDYSKDHITSSVEQSLTNLNTDYIDLLLLHRPSPLLNADVVAQTLSSLVLSGKVKHIGVSNFTPAQFQLLQSRLDIPLITNQIELNFNQLQPLIDGSIDFLYERKIKPMIWSPLGGGSIFEHGKVALNKPFQLLGAKYQVGADVLSLAWLLKHPAQLIPVIGTVKTERIISAVKACSIDLELQEWFQLYEAAMGNEVP
ncbi:MAG: aldo/keto reductase [Saprospiraceae bacterium]|nr:aldo/keto reductase [Saprospiraceae bacterium]